MAVGNSSKLSRSSSLWMLFLMASLHLCAELSHFMIGVVSKYVARDIHYGTKACFKNNDLSDKFFNTSICANAKSQESCENVTIQNEFKACHWDWTGLGGEYQFLAGPSFMAIYTVACILWGMLADKCDRVYILFSSSILFSLATIFTAVATQFWHLVVLRMLLAAGVSGVAIIAPGLIFNMFTENERGLAMGLFHWGMYLGNGLTFVVGKYITEMNLFNAGWRITFVISGLPSALLSVLLLLTAKDLPRSSKYTDSHSGRISKKQTSTLSSSSCGMHVAHMHQSADPPNEDDDDTIETEALEDCCDIIDEAEVLISSGTDENQSRLINSASSSNSINKMGSMSCCLHPVVYLLGVGACLRHSAGFTWGYNSALYFQYYYPSYGSTSVWLTWITVLGGSLGVILGGYMSDRLVSRLGISSRALVIAASQIIAAPFALGLLYLNPPYAFMSLFVGYLFAEMWYAVVFAILVELLPSSFRSLGLAVSLFVVNNVGGNLPIIVTPLSNTFGYRGALTILYPGALFCSSILFFMTYIALLRKW